MDNFTYTAYLVGSNKPEKRLHLSPKKEKKSHPELTQLWDPVQFSLYSFHRNVGKYPRRNTQQATIVFLYKTFWDIKVWSNAPMIAFRQKKNHKSYSIGYRQLKYDLCWAVVRLLILSIMPVVCIQISKINCCVGLEPAVSSNVLT